MFRAIFCPSSGAYDSDLQLLVLCPSAVVGWVRRAATWQYVYGMKDVASSWTYILFSHIYDARCNHEDECSCCDERRRVVCVDVS